MNTLVKILLSLNFYCAVSCVCSSPAPPIGNNTMRSDRSTLPPATSSRQTRTDEERRSTEKIRSKKIPYSGQEIFRKCSPAVFMIFTANAAQQYQGSGFFISPDGLAVSNYHVFEGTYKGYEVIHLQDGRDYHVKNVIVSDENNDIIVFAVDGKGTKFNYLTLSSTQPQVGDRAYAIGSPRGLENTFSSGEISQLRGNGVLQISVPIDHGSSGGALLNEYGEAIGITSAGFDDSGANLNFAISTDLIKKYLIE